MKKILTTLALCGVWAMPAASQSAFETPVTGEILTGWQRADGTRMAAIKLTLAPGWKTYWRAPGDAGIPPQISWAGSKNLSGVGIVWPTPEVFYQSGMRSIGYKDELILPIALNARAHDKAIHLEATLDIGICSDICVPHQMKLSGSISDSNTSPTPAIAAALVDRPYSAKDGGVRSATCSLRPTAEGLEIEAKLRLPATGGKEVVVIEPGQRGIWMSETDTMRSGQTLTATGDLVPSGDSAMVIDRSKIVITVFGEKRAVEIRGCPQG